MPVARKNDVTIRLAFAGPTEHPTATTLQDWIEIKVGQPEPLVIIVYKPADGLLAEFTRERKLLTCLYTDLARLEEHSRPYALQAARSRDIGFAGVVDRIEYPRAISGWLRFRDHSGLVEGFTVTAQLGDTTLGCATPDRPRVDVTGSEHYPCGFTITCNEPLDPRKILDGKLKLTASASDGSQYYLTIWEQVLAEAWQTLPP